MSASVELEAARIRINRRIIGQVKRRAYYGANELRNASLLILRGGRSGRRYRIPGTRRHYTASAPGEPPAVRTGTFRNSWVRSTELLSESNNHVSVKMEIRSNVRCPNGHLLGDYLENGNSKMAPRPHHEKIQQKAKPRVVRVFKQPYF